MSQVRFIHIAMSNHQVVGLTANGRVYGWDKYEKIWVPIPMTCKEAPASMEDKEK